MLRIWTAQSALGDVRVLRRLFVFNDNEGLMLCRSDACVVKGRAATGHSTPGAPGGSFSNVG